MVTECGYEHEAAAEIIQREQDLGEPEYSTIDRIEDTIDTFDLASQITEVRRLLQEDGELEDFLPADVQGRGEEPEIGVAVYRLQA